MITAMIVIALVVSAGLACHVFAPSVLAGQRRRRELRRTERADRQAHERAAQLADLARQDAERKEQQDRENVLVRHHPHDFAARAGYRVRARLAPWAHRRGVVSREIELLDAEIERSAPEHEGFDLGVRVIGAVLVPLMVVGSLVLNILIFLALNGEDGGLLSVIGAVAKGAAFTVTEVAVAAAAAGLYRQRGQRTVAWKISVWATLLTLLLCLTGVVYYAPARSAQVWAPTLQTDQVRLAELRAQQPTDEAAIAAQQATLTTDTESRNKDATSDIVMALVLPLAEVLCFHLALEGAQAVRRRQRRAQQQRRRAELVDTRDQIEETLETEKDKGVAAIVDALIAAGHTDVDRYLAGPQPDDRRGALGSGAGTASPAGADGPDRDDLDGVHMPGPRAAEPPVGPQTPSGPIPLRVIRRPGERPPGPHDGQDGQGPAPTVIETDPPTARHRARAQHPSDGPGDSNSFDIIGSG